MKGKNKMKILLLILSKKKKNNESGWRGAVYIQKRNIFNKKKKEKKIQRGYNSF